MIDVHAVQFFTQNSSLKMCYLKPIYDDTKVTLSVLIFLHVIYAVKIQSLSYDLAITCQLKKVNTKQWRYYCVTKNVTCNSLILECKLYGVT